MSFWDVLLSPYVHLEFTLDSTEGHHSSQEICETIPLTTLVTGAVPDQSHSLWKVTDGQGRMQGYIQG